jgi:aryl-alcohol dehydrogenase-like predicted oxidoreductase
MFILGTANFGNDYPGSKTYIDAYAAKMIIEEFLNVGGTELDTAEAYGKSPDIIQKLDKHLLHIGTKFSSKLMLDPYQLKIFLHKINNKFEKKLSSLLLHDILYLEKIPKSSLDVLEHFLQEYPKIKFGVSVYYPEEVVKACDYCKYISIVQAPLNYFDRRFVTEDFKNFCKVRAIKVTYRSIFLQGKLLVSENNMHPYFKKFKQFQKYFLDYQKSKCRSLVDFNIFFVNQVADFSNVVLGIESPQQIKEIIGSINIAKQESEFLHFNELEFDERLSVPMHWKLT